jgi:hypothetical protein
VPKDSKPELPIIQHTYDFILYAIPILNRWPRDHKHLLGDRIAEGLYDCLEGLGACPSYRSGSPHRALFAPGQSHSRLP